MEGVDKLRLEIEIEKGYNLMRVFNLINTDQRSPVFVYEGVRFWREHDQFVIRYGKTVVELGDILDYDEFRRAVFAKSHQRTK